MNVWLTLPRRIRDDKLLPPPCSFVVYV